MFMVIIISHSLGQAPVVMNVHKLHDSFLGSLYGSLEMGVAVG